MLVCALVTELIWRPVRLLLLDAFPEPIASVVALEHQCDALGALVRCTSTNGLPDRAEGPVSEPNVLMK